MATGPLGWCVYGAEEAPLNRPDTLNVKCWQVKQSLEKNEPKQTHASLQRRVLSALQGC